MESESSHRSNDSDGGARDTEAIQAVISKVKSQGLFDQFRKDCLADVDTKPAYQNLVQRVEMYVERFLRGQKWSSSVNKNQLRENLRRQLNNSGMMSNGVERIIDQVVNPKINLGIKPKIDEAVCNHLGIDLKARQEEQQRRKQEQQQLMLQQQQLQQQHLKTLINPNVKTDQAFPPAGIIGPTDVPWTQASTKFPTPAPGTDSTVTRPPLAPPGVSNFPGVMQTPFSFMGGWPVGLPGMEGFNQTGIPPMIPGQPMIPPMFGTMMPPTGNGIGTFPISPASGGVNNSSSFNTPPPPAQVTPVSTPVIPDLSKPPPGLPTTPMQNSVTNPVSSLSAGSAMDSNPLVRPLHGLVPPKTGVIVPPPPGSVPPPPGTVPVIRPSAPIAPPRPNVPTTPTIPALISHTLAKASEDELTPEKIAVFKTAAAFITKTVNNAQGTPGADLATMFSPRVLAEAMMAESGVPLTKHEIRAAKRKERMKELDRLRAERDREEIKDHEVNEDKEDPIPPKHNLMDVFQAAEDVSDDEEALDMLMDVEETEDKNKQGVVLSDDSDKEEPTPTNQPGKRYNFAWDVDINPGELSDVTISSIHTSDISSFEDDAISSDGDMEIGGEKDDKKDHDGKEQTLDKEVKETGSSHTSDHAVVSDQEEKLHDTLAKSEESLLAGEGLNKEWKETGTVESSKEQESLFAADIVPLIPPVTSLNVKTKEKSGTLDTGKPRRLVALSYNYSDNEEEETREERKARIAKEKEERYLKRQQRRADIEAKRKERDEERARLKEEKKRQKELQAKLLEDKGLSGADTGTEDNVTAPSLEEESPSKTTPRKRKNKAEMKEQLLQQKVLERKALRRRRTRNRRYASEEFTTIFSERKTLNQSYTTEPVVESEEIVTFDGALEVVEMTVDQECVVETIGEVVETIGTVEESNKETGAAGGEHPTELVLQCPSPYSDISDRSMSDKLEDEKSNSGMDKVSSDEELGDVEEEREDGKETDKVDDETREESCAEQSGDQKLHESPSRMATRSHSSLSVTESLGESTAAEEKNKSPTSVERKSSQQQNMDELNKAQNCQRRVSSPSTSREPSSPRGSGGGGREQCESDVESQHSSTTKQSWQKAASVSSVTDLKSLEQIELKSENVLEETEKMQSPKEPVDIMADLELEPVSPGDMSLDELSPEEAEPVTMTVNKEDSGNDSVAKTDLKEPVKAEEHRAANEIHKLDSKKKDGGKEEESEPSDEGEIKSDSEEEKKNSEEAKERVAHRKPIELVDFGEAEKRVREARYYTDVERRNRTQNLPPVPYRGGYTASQWPQSSAGVLGYSSSVSRYSGHEPGSPGRAKSPLGTTFDAESEASSHSRSSVRVRDDVPPPYPIEGVSQRHRSPASEKGASSLFKPAFPPPSPVSSSSSSSSRNSRNSRKTRSSRNSARRSKSRSSSSSSSSSSSRSSSSRSLRHKRKRPQHGKQAEKRKERAVASSPAKSHIPRTLGVEPRIMPPAVENVEGGDIPAQRERRFSSGHESISSDELPYFPDEEPSHVGTAKHRSSGESSSSGEVSSSPRRKRKRSADSVAKESISSSELIYSPTRKQSLSAGKEQALSQDGSSPGRSSISSEELPEDIGDTEIGPAAAYSPHRPSSPTHLPPMPTDMTGFQPPLPQELPPLPAEDQPPLPPSPPPPLPNDDSSLSFAEADSYQSTDFPYSFQNEPSRPPFSPVNISENTFSSYNNVSRQPEDSLNTEAPASPTAVNMEAAGKSPHDSNISDQPASPEMSVYTEEPPLLVIPLERRSSDTSSPVHGSGGETPVSHSPFGIHTSGSPNNDTLVAKSSHAHASTSENQSEDKLQPRNAVSHVDTCQPVVSHRTVPVHEKEEQKSQESCSPDHDNHAFCNSTQEQNPLVCGASDEEKSSLLTGIKDSVECKNSAGISLSDSSHGSNVLGGNVESNTTSQDMGLLKLDEKVPKAETSITTGEHLEPVKAVENETVQLSNEGQGVNNIEKLDTAIESSVNTASEISSVKSQSPDCHQGFANAGVSTDSIHESRLSKFQSSISQPSVPQAMCLIPSLLEDSPSTPDSPGLSQEAISSEKSSPSKEEVIDHSKLSQNKELQVSSTSASPQLEPSSEIERVEVNTPSKSHLEKQAAFDISNPHLIGQSTGEVSTRGGVRSEEVTDLSEMATDLSDNVGVESFEKKSETVSHSMSKCASDFCAPTSDCEKVSGHETTTLVSVLPGSLLGKRVRDDVEKDTLDIVDEPDESSPKRRCIEKQPEDENISATTSGPSTECQAGQS